MIRLRDISLPADTRRRLRKLQHEIGSIADYAERILAAKESFSRNNKRNNPIFSAVRKKLTRMCSGAQRCCYCEDSAADEVEHIKPKDLYPEETFVWENYLYACGPCNGPKNNQFAVFSLATGAFIDVTRKRGDAIAPPVDGEPVLINPRREDPLDFLEIDLIGTFFFLPIHEEGSREYHRADYTIKVLRLNERDLLPAARKEAFGSYRARLREYINIRDSGAPRTQIRNLIAAIQRMQHPAVWREMKRQRELIPHLRELFDQAPEAIGW